MRTIMITGAGSGMGQELARRALARGDRVIATVRNHRDASELGEHHDKLIVVEMNVGSSSSVEAAFIQVDRELAGKPLDLIMHCAAIAPSGALEVEGVELLEQTLNVNAVGVARILRHALPRLRGHRGRILLFSSLWGKVAGPMLSAYCASKHAIEAITDSVRREIEGQDIDIVLIEPGVVRTNMVSGSVSGSRAGSEQLPASFRSLYGSIYERYARLIERESTGGLSVDQAAALIERAAFTAAPRTRYSVGRDAVLVKALARLLPDKALDAVFRKMLNRC
ncbi:SDR family NAD(P)-dependent oxidoreductase [Burkholderia sp. Ac-20353]|uniref:SDR family NAD(P)-dependent oxidoreductase n=1 Tax=Burkholderia sp. Ac-20353 TaxID=2703894 RepID=UPI00197C6947|nr:SDR family NAD(P)-dependent oxidoreductase [Burkholderia sp. Ac-20353]MBN3788533.1 SDR family NAD(P)-dependent oxidoreductase [Burkholderia sp. Ac-20353]